MRPGYRRDSNGHHALADLQSLGIRAQGLDTAHAFHVTPDSGKLGGETVAATQHVQITGVNRSRLHADQRLTGLWCGDGPGFQSQDIGRLADLSGYERAHGLWHGHEISPLVALDVALSVIFQPFQEGITSCGRPRRIQ
jgi:hypothetical protein